MFLYAYGGVYLDMDVHHPQHDAIKELISKSNNDVVGFKTLDALRAIGPLTMVCTQLFRGAGGRYSNNNIMVSRRHHPFWLYFLNAIHTQGFMLFGTIKQSFIGTLASAGPLIMTRSAKKWMTHSHRPEDQINLVWVDRNSSIRSIAVHQSAHSWGLERGLVKDVFRVGALAGIIGISIAAVLL